jgi:hypothetical protein
MVDTYCSTVFNWYQNPFHRSDLEGAISNLSITCSHACVVVLSRCESLQQKSDTSDSEIPKIKLHLIGLKNELHTAQHQYATIRKNCIRVTFRFEDMMDFTPSRSLSVCMLHN